jgi:hypothetical protein
MREKEGRALHVPLEQVPWTVASQPVHFCAIHFALFGTLCAILT